MSGMPAAEWLKLAHLERRCCGRKRRWWPVAVVAAQQLLARADADRAVGLRNKHELKG